MNKNWLPNEHEGIHRRTFLAMMGAAGATIAGLSLAARRAAAEVIEIQDMKEGEDVFAYTERINGKFDQTLYQQVIGAANDFKEGDLTIAVGAKDEDTRKIARELLAKTKIKDLYEHPLLADDLQELIWKTTDPARYEKVKDWTMGELKESLLTQSERDIKGVMAGLTSDTIGCVPKLMTNDQLIALGQNTFNPLPGTQIGSKGYMGARIQPNSPTGHPDDVFWQTLNAFSYATGDIVIGTNPVDSQVISVAAVEDALKDVVDTFKLNDIIPWCVLSHIDVQAEVASQYPGSVETMFQSLAGTDKNDPMLSYLSTSFQDHVRIREKFDYKVNDVMWDFYRRIGIVGADKRYTRHFGDPLWVYYRYRQAKGDRRSKDEIHAEGRKKIEEVEARGVDIATGHGRQPWDLNPEIEAKVNTLYEDAKISLWVELTPDFVEPFPIQCLSALCPRTVDYISNPGTGEKLSPQTIAVFENLRASWGADLPKGQIVISDGLNAKAIMDENHLMPFVGELRKLLAEANVPMSETNIVVTGGRVRAGYRFGELLFGKSEPNTFRGILHIIGERPGTMHHAYSVYITVAKGATWAKKKIDHDITGLLCNIADKALAPKEAARETITIIREMVGRKVKNSRLLGRV